MEELQKGTTYDILEFAEGTDFRRNELGESFYKASNEYLLSFNYASLRKC